MSAFSYTIKRVWYTFLIIAGMITTLGFSQKYHVEPHGIGHSGDRINNDILLYVNQYRQSKGLGALQMNDVISKEALRHSVAMAAKKTAFGHDGFEERVRLIVQQLGPLKLSAENVAYGTLSAREVVDVWLNSPGHRKNIEGNYALTGIGVATASDGTLFFTQIFGTR